MKKLFFLLGLLYFSTHGSTTAEKNIEALRKYIPGEPGNLKLTEISLRKVISLNLAGGIFF